MDNVYIRYSATIMPNVRIGKNVIIGAGALVSKDLELNGVYVRVPAKKIYSFDDYIERHREKAGSITSPMWSIIRIFQNQKLRERGAF